MTNRVIDFKQIRKDLIELYEEFIENPEDKKLLKEIGEYDFTFGGLSGYNDYLKNPIVPEDVKLALNGLSGIRQYGMWKEGHGLSNTNLMKRAREDLDRLKALDK